MLFDFQNKKKKSLGWEWSFGQPKRVFRNIVYTFYIRSCLVKIICDCVSITKSLKLVATYTFRSTISTVNFENLL